MASKPRVNAVLKEWRPKAAYLYTNRAGNTNSHTSPPFSSEASPGVAWKLTVRNGDTSPCTSHAGCDACSKYLEFFLEREGGGEAKELEPELFVSVSGLNVQGNWITKTELVRASRLKVQIFPAVDGRMYLSGCVIAALVSFDAPAAQRVSPVEAWVSRLLADPDKLADFHIRVGEERISIYRALFAAASPVFARMFERDMEEKAQGFVVIEDFSAETMRGLRAFLYTGRVSEVHGDLATYLDLAEKYGMEELKEVCRAELRKTLRPGNLCGLAVLAQRYDLWELMDDCRAAVKKTDGTPAVAKEDWDRLVQDHRNVARRFPKLSFPDPPPPVKGPTPD